MTDNAVEAPRRLHVPEIDSLRCIAVASVLVFHAQLGGPISKVGWTGVWLFFVISGFVITLSILGDDRPRATFGQRMKGFWLRRSLRILPLYYLSIAVFSVLFVMHGRQIAEHIPYLLTFTYNFFRMSPDYADPARFGHYWSLSVEEQFYLLYPVCFFLLLGRLAVLRAILIGALIAGPVIRYVCGAIALKAFGDPDAAGNAVYQFSPGHFDAFAMGALIALNARKLSASNLYFYAAGALGLLALAAYLALCIATRSGELNAFGAILDGLKANAYGPFQHAALYSVINLIFAAAILGTISGVRPYKMLLSFRPAIYIGKISYGIYVFHSPILYFYNHYAGQVLPKANTPVGFVLYAAVVVAVSAVSFRFFEQPILKLRSRFERAPATA